MPVNRKNFKLDMIKLAAYAVCRYCMQLTKHALITRNKVHRSSVLQIVVCSTQEKPSGTMGEFGHRKGFI